MRVCVSQYPAQLHDLHEDMHWFPIICDFHEDQICSVGRATNQRYSQFGRHCSTRTFIGQARELDAQSVREYGVPQSLQLFQGSIEPHDREVLRRCASHDRNFGSAAWVWMK